jgi:ribonucleoside-triphosphate reductase
LEASPAEGATYRFAKKDKELYPNIVVANDEAVKNQGASPYYTNSSHLPVGFTNDIFEALDLQDNLQTKYTGGTVLHGFIGERINDIESCKRLVKKIAETYRLPYFTITPTFSICPKHGYLAGEHKFCPKCDAEIGYIDGVKDDSEIFNINKETITERRIVEQVEGDDKERNLIQSLS